jgi:hypothetical protein
MAVFSPSYKLAPRILRQLKAVERTCGFHLQPEWIQELRRETEVREALAGVQIEGNSLTLEQAFELSHELPTRELRNSEREFCNYFELSEYYNADRDLYYGGLRTADRTGEYTEWLEYFPGGFSHQMWGIEEGVKKGQETWSS